jgi:uncharacterized membrane protein YhaH (DUF805 family)
MTDMRPRYRSERVPRPRRRLGDDAAAGWPPRNGAAMRFGEAFTTCMRKYADFSGRARRSEYWWFYLALQLIMLPFAGAFMVADLMLFVGADYRPDGTMSLSGADFAPLVVTFALMMIVSLAFTLPSYAATVRRLHDMGQSGLWVLLGFVGLGLVATVMCIMDTQPGTNQWGPDPKAGERVGYGYPQAYPTITPAYPPITPPGPPAAPPLA